MLEKDYELLRYGKAPESCELLEELTVGEDEFAEFLTKQYFREYIPQGGSKIKFLTGRAGSGKTHFARLLRIRAEKENHLTVYLSAKDVWLHDFREIYLGIVSRIDLPQLLKRCADRIIREIGYDPEDIAPGKSLMDVLSERGEADALSRGEIRAALRRFFTRNPLLDNNFACACSLLVGGILGHPMLEPSGRDLLYQYLYGDKTVKLALLRTLGLSPSRITRYNARYLLKSLSELVHLSGYQGMLVVIDDMETVLNRSSESSMRYTKLRREDTYESIRQLIDDIDEMHYLMFLLVFDRELMDDDSYGMKSYQALYMRIQNEVVSTRFNRFADIIDMDRFGEEFFGERELLLMAEKLSAALGLPAGSALSSEDMADLKKRADFGGLGLPYLVNRAVTAERNENGGL